MEHIHILQLPTTIKIKILKKVLIRVVNANQLDDNEKAVLVYHTEFYESECIRVLLKYSHNLHVSDECLSRAFQFLKMLASCLYVAYFFKNTLSTKEACLISAKEDIIDDEFDNQNTFSCKYVELQQCILYLSTKKAHRKFLSNICSDSLKFLDHKETDRPFKTKTDEEDSLEKSEAQSIQKLLSHKETDRPFKNEIPHKIDEEDETNSLEKSEAKSIHKPINDTAETKIYLNGKGTENYLTVTQSNSTKVRHFYSHRTSVSNDSGYEMSGRQLQLLHICTQASNDSAYEEEKSRRWHSNSSISSVQQLSSTFRHTAKTLNKLLHHPWSCDKLSEYTEIGQGSYGIVYDALYNGNSCVAKANKKGYNRGAFFLKEISIHKSLEHPNIVQFIDVYHHKNTPLLIMEKMWSSLSKWLRISHPSSLGTKIKILIDVTNGLKYLHSRNIIHCDLSANNILLSENLQAKIGDFGMANKIGENMVRLPGNFSHMPPEARMHDPVYSEKLDIFSFGCVMIHTVIQEFPAISDSKCCNCTEVDNRSKYLEKLKYFPRIHSVIVQCLQNNSSCRPSANLLHCFLKACFLFKSITLHCYVNGLLEYKEIGQGAYSTMYLTLCSNQPCVCFSKKIHSCNMKNNVKGMLKDISTLGSLNHTQVVNLLYAPCNKSAAIKKWWINLSMELKNNFSTFCLDKIRVIAEIASGLTYLHLRNISHYDVTAENVVFSIKLQTKLCNFDNIGKNRRTVSRNPTLKACFHNVFHSVAEKFYGLNTCSRTTEINKRFTYLVDLQDEPITWISANELHYLLKMWLSIRSKEQYLSYQPYHHQPLDDLLPIMNINFLVLLHHRFVYKCNQQMDNLDENAKTASFVHFVLNLCINLCKQPSLNRCFLKLLPIILIIKLCNKSLLHRGKSIYLLRHELSLIDPFIKLYKKIGDKNKALKRTPYNKKEVKFTTSNAKHVPGFCSYSITQQQELHFNNTILQELHFNNTNLHIGGVSVMNISTTNLAYFTSIDDKGMSNFKMLEKYKQTKLLISGSCMIVLQTLKRGNSGEAVVSLQDAFNVTMLNDLSFKCFIGLTACTPYQSTKVVFFIKHHARSQLFLELKDFTIKDTKIESPWMLFYPSSNGFGRLNDYINYKQQNPSHSHTLSLETNVSCGM